VYAAAAQFSPQGNFTPTQGSPREIFVLLRGNEQTPDMQEGVVGPSAVASLAPAVHRVELPPDHNEAQRRAALAAWIVDRDNPLTWRSIVNRVWHYHFGQGIVDSPNDFGRMGTRPTHPQLLDWLAAEFRDNGQSFKNVHRLIVTSAVYRQSSQSNEQSAKIVAGNQLLWRMHRRKMEAEGA
ncbi:MAG: DUF1553 domain-containing protein, partial [Planctomycetaceae bacterium]|nr:DUF1553 domain-containing protein [Planctomycetaceae bacterium]